MYFFKFPALLHLVFLSFSCALPNQLDIPDRDIANLRVNSNFDLTGRFAKLKNTITFVNRNASSVKTYKYVVNETDLYRIKFRNTQGQRLNFENNKENSSFVTTHEVALDEELLINQQYTIVCSIVYARKIIPATKKRRMKEDQLMKFEGNLFFFSPYVTEFLEVTYLLNNHSLVEITETPTTMADDNITFRFHNISSYCDHFHIVLVFVNNNPFLVVKNLYKTITISHIGKITVQDEIVLQNIGAKLTGPYSPDINSPQYKAMATWFYTHLPASAENIEFFDFLGNSSLTKLYYFYNYITLKFRTRIPLLGGWKTSYILRYNLPPHEYIYVVDNRYLLKMRSIDYLIDSQHIEEALIKIALPEGAVLNNVYKPPSLDYQRQEIGCTSGFCVSDRQIVVLNGSNLFDYYVATVIVDYYFNPLSLIRAPLAISCFLQIFFLIFLSIKYFVY